jgi:hypothetical protein
MMVSVGVLAVFVAFAAVLFWADDQTSGISPKPSDGKRRSL